MTRWIILPLLHRFLGQCASFTGARDLLVICGSVPELQGDVGCPGNGAFHVPALMGKPTPSTGSIIFKEQAKQYYYVSKA